MGRIALLLLIALGTIVTPAAADDGEAWPTDLEEALATAKADARPLLVYVLDGD